MMIFSISRDPYENQKIEKVYNLEIKTDTILYCTQNAIQDRSLRNSHFNTEWT